jgi:gamma-glutamyltranspeptidase/glutathione hydrolase
MRNIHLGGRSAVYGQNGVAATSHPLATSAALDILKRGGNAVDAAIAASAVLCVVEPFSTGIGGDCFVIFAPKGSGELIGLNGSGRAPRGLSLDQLKEAGIEELSNQSVHSVTIPGAVDAWSRLMADHGKLGLEAALQPAISYAEDGFAVTPIIGAGWNMLLDHISTCPNGRKHLTLAGRAPQVGEIFRQPTLAKTLRQIAAQGRSGFYEGWVAEDMVQFLSAQGGAHTVDDFAETSADYVQPIATPYQDLAVHEIPPNGQGITALIMLNILSHFDLGHLDPIGAERIHLEMEAQRLAFELRDTFVSDQDFGEVPIEAMLSMETAERLAARIDPKEAMKDVATATSDLKRDTIYLSVIDRDLNAVSFINSLYYGFGSGLVSPETAVTFQNRGLGFSLDPSHLNRLQGGKRPKHTIIPGMLVHGSGPHTGKAIGPFGVMGGDYQPVGHTHVVTNLCDFGMDPQQSLDCPRSFFDDGTLMIEDGISDETCQALIDKGHKVERCLVPFGGGQIAQIDWQHGTLVAGSEPRKDGCAGAI